MAKVIHIVETLDRGAIESWLLRMLSFARANGAACDWTFYCMLPGTGIRDAEAKRLGAAVVHSPVDISNTLSFMVALRRELIRGSYDVIHCHHDLVSSVYLLAAAGLRIRRRIVHVHNADESLPTPNETVKALLRPIMRWICLHLANMIVGISKHTLKTFLAGRRPRPGRDLVHYYGVDPSPFLECPDRRRSLRERVRLPDEAIIVLFGGRIVPEKNPLFAIDVLAELHRIVPNAFLVYAGSGSLETEIFARATQHGVQGFVLTLGWQNDLGLVMRGSDLFILPRPEFPREGFGLAVVEAQLAGLPLLISAGVVDDPLLPHASYKRLSLMSSAREWALAAADLIRAQRPSVTVAHSDLEASPMNMAFAWHELSQMHS